MKIKTITFSSKEENKELIDVLKVVSLIDQDKLDATNIALLSKVIGVDVASITDVSEVLKSINEVNKEQEADTENKETGESLFSKIKIAKIEKYNYSEDAEKISDAAKMIKVIDSDILKCPEAFADTVAVISDVFDLPKNLIESLVDIKVTKDSVDDKKSESVEDVKVDEEPKAIEEDKTINLSTEKSPAVGDEMDCDGGKFVIASINKVSDEVFEFVNSDCSKKRVGKINDFEFKEDSKCWFAKDNLNEQKDFSKAYIPAEGEPKVGDFMHDIIPDITWKIGSIEELDNGDILYKSEDGKDSVKVNSPKVFMYDSAKNYWFSKDNEDLKIVIEKSNKVINFAKSIYYEGVSKSKVVSFLKGCQNFSGNPQVLSVLVMDKSKKDFSIGDIIIEITDKFIEKAKEGINEAISYLKSIDLSDEEVDRVITIFKKDSMPYIDSVNELSDIIIGK